MLPLFLPLCSKTTVVREPVLPGGGVDSAARLREKYKMGVLELCGDDVRDLLQPKILVLREGAAGMYMVG